VSVRLLLVLVVVNLGLGGGLRKAALGVWEGELDGVIKLGGEERRGEDMIHRSAFSCTGWLVG
jgi:hypothetical protein